MQPAWKKNLDHSSHSAGRGGERWRRAASARTCKRVPPAAIRSTEKLAPPRVPKDAHICRKQLVKTAGGKPLRVVLTFARTQMLLVNTIVVVANLVHENVQEHERPRLGLRKTTGDAILSPIIRNGERVKNVLVVFEIWHREICPKILVPSVEINRSSLLSVKELVGAVTVITRGR